MKAPIGRNRLVLSLTKNVHDAVEGRKPLLIETPFTKKLVRHYRSIEPPAERRARIYHDFHEITSNYHPMAMESIVFLGEGLLYKHVLDNIVLDENTKYSGVKAGIREAARDGVILFLLNHQTNLDAMIDGYAFHKVMKDLQPQFCAGTKIGKGLAKHILPMLGAWFVSKNGQVWQIGRDQMYMAGSLANCVNTVLYPQGTRPLSGEFKFDSQKGVLDAAMHFAGIPGMPTVYVCNVTKSYSFIPEDKKFYECFKAGVKMPSADLLAEFSTLADEYKKVAGAEPSMIWHMHEPVPLADYGTDAGEAGNKILKEIADARVIPPIPAVNIAMDTFDGEFDFDELVERTVEHAGLMDNMYDKRLVDVNYANMTVSKLLQEYFLKRRLVSGGDKVFRVVDDSVRFTTNLYKDMYPAFIQEKL